MPPLDPFLRKLQVAKGGKVANFGLCHLLNFSKISHFSAIFAPNHIYLYHDFQKMRKNLDFSAIFAPNHIYLYQDFQKMRKNLDSFTSFLLQTIYIYTMIFQNRRRKIRHSSPLRSRRFYSTNSENCAKFIGIRRIKTP